MENDRILIATETRAIDLDGQTYELRRDVTRVRASHPLASTYPELFKEADVHYEVEQMTAAPGEKRGAASRSTG